VTVHWSSYQDSDIHNFYSRNKPSQAVLFHFSTHLQGTFSCLSPLKKPSACQTHCAPFFCHAGSLIHCLLLLLLLHSLLVVFHSSLLPSSPLLIFNFSRMLLPQSSLDISTLAFLSFLHLCQSLSELPSLVPRPFPCHFNALSALYIITPQFLSIIPSICPPCLSDSECRQPSFSPATLTFESLWSAWL